jgi:hypothetical protein
MGSADFDPLSRDRDMNYSAISMVVPGPECDSVAGCFFGIFFGIFLVVRIGGGPGPATFEFGFMAWPLGGGSPTACTWPRQPWCGRP